VPAPKASAVTKNSHAMGLISSPGRELEKIGLFLQCRENTRFEDRLALGEG
jgi:hypothetical protein